MNIHSDLFGSAQAPPPPGRDALFEAGNVQPNVLGTTDLLELELAEQALGAFRGWEISIGIAVAPNELSIDYLRDVHYHLMQDIYLEAGGTRQDMLDRARVERDEQAERGVPASRMGAQGQLIRLLPAVEVNQRLELLAELLRKENYLRGHLKSEFVNRLTAYYLSFTQAAPFPTGNAAVAHTLFSQVGKRAGYDVNLARAPQLERLTDAVLAAEGSSDQRALQAALSEAIKEAPGPSAALARRATLQVLPQQVPQK